MGESDDRRIDDRLRALEDAVRELREQVAALSAAARSSAASRFPSEAPPRPDAAEGTPWGLRFGRPLAAMAILSTVLVLALLLRTFADKGWVGGAVGAGLGVGYCALLLAAGALSFGRSRLTGTLLAVSGTFLCLLVVVENFHRYRSITLAAALWTLGGLALATAAVGARFRSRGVAGFGVLGGTFVATVLDLPDVVFVWLGCWLAAAGVLSYVLAYRTGWRWLRWPVFLMTTGAMSAWAAFVAIEGPGEPRVAWFGPIVAALSVLHVGIPVWRAAAGGAKLDWFEAAVPVLGTTVPLALGLWTFGPGIAPIGVGTGAVLLAYGAWHTVHRDRTPRAGGTFLFAGTVLAVWWLPYALEDPLAYGPLVSLGAVALFDLGRRAATRTPRVIAHLAQVANVGALVTAGSVMLVPPSGGAGRSIAVGAATAVLALLQYALSRVRRPPADGFLRTVDGCDRMALAPLIAGIVAAFGTVRVAGFAALGVATDPAAASTFRAYQSVSASVLVAVALVVALWVHLPELLGVALLALLLVAIKVVFWDVFVLPGPQAMASVLALAVVTGVASIAIQRRRAAR